jgi:hypothetical protein
MQDCLFSSTVAFPHNCLYGEMMHSASLTKETPSITFSHLHAVEKEGMGHMWGNREHTPYEQLLVF